MTYLLKYTHPAVPKDRLIKVNDVYDLEFLKEIYNIKKIKILFTPIDFEWGELEPVTQYLEFIKGEKITD
jgi:hypothetical protein